jgi:hypothetical protein
VIEEALAAAASRRLGRQHPISASLKTFSDTWAARTHAWGGCRDRVNG